MTRQRNACGRKRLDWRVSAPDPFAHLCKYRDEVQWFVPSPGDLRNSARFNSPAMISTGHPQP